MKFKLSPEALRQVRRHLIAASWARWMARAAADRGDDLSARLYRLENSFELSEARLVADRDYSAQIKKATTETLQLLAELFPDRFNKPVEALQDEPVSEQVSAEPASPRMSVRGVLVGKAAPGAITQPRRVCVQLVNFDGVFPNRLEFPRLGKHWAPSSVLVGNQERKGHSVLRP